MPASIQIPNGLYSFTASGADGKPIDFELDLIEAHEAINAIGKECKEANLTNFEHVHKFAAWLKAKTGAALIPGQADYLMDRIVCEYANSKKEVRALLDSASSTAPAPVS